MSALVEVVMLGVVPSAYPTWARMRKTDGKYTYLQVLAWALLGPPGTTSPTSISPLITHPQAGERGMNMVLLSSLLSEGYTFTGYQTTPTPTP